MIKVLIVDDSATARANLEFILASDPEIKIIGSVVNGEEAVQFLEKKGMPDVISMDIVMPKMDGFEATKIIMEKYPVPIVIVSSSSSMDEVEKSFKAFEAGALALLGKPGKATDLKKPEIRNLIKTMKTMSKVSVVRRWARDKYKTNVSDETTIVEKPKQSFKYVVIGVSTGGPPALQQLLKQLPKEFYLPIVIVQHIATGFVKGLVEWLKTECEVNVKIAEDGEKLKPSTVYFAGDGYQLGIDANERIFFSDSEAEYGVKPSVSFLFNSVTQNSRGNVIAVLMTGMGKDGAAELKKLKNIGAMTIIQDEETSVVFGMPGVAKSLNAHRMELNPKGIGRELANLHLNHKNKQS